MVAPGVRTGSVHRTGGSPSRARSAATRARNSSKWAVLIDVTPGRMGVVGPSGRLKCGRLKCGRWRLRGEVQELSGGVVSRGAGNNHERRSDTTHGSSFTLSGDGG